jgi:penicillin-binding protein 1A
MILRTRCPTCGATYRLQEPLPPEGKRYRCTCKTVITISYPEAVRERIRATQLAMEQEDAAVTQPVGTSPVTQQSPALSPAEPRPPIQDDGTLPSSGPREPSLQERAARSRAEAHLSKPPSIPPMRPPRPLPKSPFDEDTPTLRRPPMGGPDVLGPGDDEPEERQTVVDEIDRPLAGPMQIDAHDDEDAEATELASPRPADEQLDHDAGGQIGPYSPAAEQPDPEDEVPTAHAMPRVQKSPSPRPGMLGSLLRRRWLHLLAGVLLATLLLGIGAIVAVLGYYSQDLPSVDSLADYEPPVVTVVKDPTGRTVGEFYEQQRYVVTMDQIPDMVRNAFVAAEDASFWEHSGLDYMGIVRAMLKNIQERRMAQGASTITQQVARSFLLTREKKLARKIKEAILASRIERNFDKEHILFLYLNQIYLGHGAYGVQAAARLYFDKTVAELSLPEAAILAGLPQAPANYSPNRNFRAAKDRQRYVLRQMARRGYITQEDADAAYERQMTFVRKHNINLDYAPFYVEHIRRYLVKTYGHEATYNHGLQVTIPVDTELQLAANAAVMSGVRAADKRIGYRGGKKLDGEEATEEALVAIDHARTRELRPYDPAYELPEGRVPLTDLPTLKAGEFSFGVVAEVTRKWALIDVGSRRGLLPLAEFKWCHNINEELNFNWFVCKRLDDIIHKGDLVEVRVVNETENWKKTLGRKFEGPVDYPRLAMEQDPDPQAALLSLRLEDGAVLAMVGGSSFTGSEFNRAIQARRQVGSTFKPLVYAAALDSTENPHTPSTILVDAPIVETRVDREGELWKPGNAGDKYLGDTTFRRGLILSRNIVTLKVLQAIGVKYTLGYMKRFGFDTALEENLAMGLGASALTLRELARAYTVFPTLGDRREPYFISEVRDRNGKILEQTEEGVLTEDVMDENTAYQMVDLMHAVVTSGTATRALALKKRVAGKTGTTNDYRDAWFVGYTPELVTVVWVGLDDFRGMGKGQYGGELALPIWMEYMAPALEKYPPSDYPKPDGIVRVRIDSKTGLLAPEGAEKAIHVVFKKHTQPTLFAPAEGQVDAADFLSGEF